jgi:hypothetical protein
MSGSRFSIKIMVFWDMMPCSLEDRYQQFEGNSFQYLEEAGFLKVLVPTYLILHDVIL